MTKNEKYLYERTYNAIWNQYLFLTSSRERIEHKFEILLILVGIVVATFFQLELYKNFLNYFPLILYLIIFLLALYNVLPRSITVPWVSKEEFKKYKNTELVHKQLVEECYKHIDDMNRYLDFKKNHLRVLIVLFLFSSLFPIITFLSGYSFILGFVSFILVVSLVICFYRLFNKPI
ncbi:MAG: hypothetical protein WA139_00675 [Candidatus Aenigmatarchaeota archaeon]